jgi:tRNA-dihydrouridine synthase B
MSTSDTRVSSDATTNAVTIGGLRIDPPLFLAPMAGLTDRHFRLLVRRIGGVGLVAMEFVSARGIVRGERLARQIMVFTQEERPLAIQIYGSDPHTMAEAARIVEASGADLCDINMGCPANKVLKGCRGAALMGDLDLAERIVASVRAAISIPLTVKFRLGLDERRCNFLELGRRCEAVGADAVTMHGRTARQMYRGKADWSQIRRLKQALSIPVIGNGDVTEPQHALDLLANSGCDGVMIGRGATRNPWLFRQIAARLHSRRGGAGEAYEPEPTLGDRRDLILHHFATLIREEGPGAAGHKLRVFTKWYSYGLPHGARLRRQIGDLRHADDFPAAVERHFERFDLEEAA